MTDTGSLASDCLQAWSSGDFDAVRAMVDDDISFVGPFGAARGVDPYVNGLQRFRQRGIKSVKVQKLFSEARDVCIIYDLVTDTSAGTIPSAAWYKIRAGKITSVQVFFDTRSLA